MKYYHPKSTSSVVTPTTDMIEGLVELGFRPLHDNNVELINVDWQPLFDWINKQLNINVAFEIDLSGIKPSIVCPNLSNESGLFLTALGEVGVDFFDFSINDNGFWATLAINYSTHKGVSSAIVFANIEYYNPAPWKWKVFPYNNRNWIIL